MAKLCSYHLSPTSTELLSQSNITSEKQAHHGCLPQQVPGPASLCPRRTQQAERWQGGKPYSQSHPPDRGDKTGCQGGSGEREVMGKQHSKGSTRDACWKAPALRQSMRDSGPGSWETGLHQPAEEKHIGNTSTAGEAARSYHQEDV